MLSALQMLLNKPLAPLGSLLEALSSGDCSEKVEPAWL
jgi:hypothetical protein